MQYQDCATEAQTDETETAPAYPFHAALSVAALADANINPQTGLATDYLNHFNEAIMLLEMAGSSSDCLADIRGWQPTSYREHFMKSHLKGRDLALAAYVGADPAARASLDNLASTMTSMIETTRSTMTPEMPAQAAGDLAVRAAAWLKPLVARAGAVINGEIDAEAGAPQATADRVMKRC